MSEKKNLPDLYFDIASRHIDEKGIFPHQMIARTKDDKMHMYALNLNEPWQVYAAVDKALREQDPAELIFSLDRFYKPGQGIELKDFLAGAYWDGTIWRPFVMEYQNEPRIVKPLNWDNEIWNRLIIKEMKEMFS